MKKKTNVLRERIEYIENELKDLYKASDAIRRAIHTSYSYGASDTFLKDLDTAWESIQNRCVQLEELKDEHHRVLEGSAVLA